MSALVLRLYIAATMVAAIWLWYIGPFEGPRTYRIPFTVVVVGATALLAGRMIKTRPAVDLVRVTGAIAITAIVIALYLSGFRPT